MARASIAAWRMGRMAAAMLLASWHAAHAQSVQPAPAIVSPSTYTPIDASCHAISDDELIARVNMATLGDARFRPVDERVGKVQIDRESSGIMLQFSSWVAQPAGEWSFFFDTCAELDIAYAFVYHSMCPGRAPRSQAQLQTLIDAHTWRTGERATDWGAYKVRQDASNCADSLHLLPKSGMLHADFHWVVRDDGDVVRLTPYGDTPSVNGQFRAVKYVGD